MFAGSVLGTQVFTCCDPQLTTFQTYPDLQPLYDAARSYLEIPQRINLLNTRVEVRSLHFLSRDVTVLSMPS